MEELLRRIVHDLHVLQEAFHRNTGRPIQEIVVTIPEPLWIYVLQAANGLWGVKLSPENLQLPDQLVVDGCFVLRRGAK